MKTTRNNLKDIMLLAWSFVRRNGFTMAEALKVAWLNAKVTKAMRGRCNHYFSTAPFTNSMDVCSEAGLNIAIAKNRGLINDGSVNAENGNVIVKLF